MTTASNMEALERLRAAVEEVPQVEFDTMAPAEQLRYVRNAVKHLGRLSGAEALGRTQAIRALQLLPMVEAAYGVGRIPIAHMRLIARVAANPRVHEHLEAADLLFAERASVDAYEPFRAWMQQGQFLADPDGAERDDEINHAKRRVSLHRNFDGSWTMDGDFGALRGRPAPHPAAAPSRRPGRDGPRRRGGTGRWAPARTVGEHRHRPAHLRRRTAPIVR